MKSIAWLVEAYQWYRNLLHHALIKGDNDSWWFNNHSKRVRNLISAHGCFAEMSISKLVVIRIAYYSLSGSPISYIMTKEHWWDMHSSILSVNFLQSTPVSGAEQERYPTMAILSTLSLGSFYKLTEIIYRVETFGVFKGATLVVTLSHCRSRHFSCTWACSCSKHSRGNSQE